MENGKKKVFEVVFREDSRTINNHLQPFEKVECDGMIYDEHTIKFYDEEIFTDMLKRTITVLNLEPKAIYNWKDVIRVTRLS